jgi:Zn-dependent peptidase ImmA (M78 family)
LASVSDSIPTKQMLSKYETGAAKPPPEVLCQLAVALGVPLSALVTEQDTEVRFVAFRRHSTLSVTEQEKIKAEITWQIQGRRKLSAAVGEPRVNWRAFSASAKSPEEAERHAVELRDEWKLSRNAISNLTAVMEEQGAEVFMLEAHEKFSGISAWTEDGQPVAVVQKRKQDGARQRMDLAHELAHVILSRDSTVEPEDYAKRFAGAFIFPESAAFAELGRKRSDFRLAELRATKMRYGISIQGIIRRARDLEIITEATYKKWSMLISKWGLRKDEGSPYVPVERPTRPVCLASRAVAEDLLPVEEAVRLGNLGSEEAQDLKPAPAELSPQERFLRMSQSDRAKAFLHESKVMAHFYAEHPEEVIPDFSDESEHEPQTR